MDDQREALQVVSKYLAKLLMNENFCWTWGWRFARWL